MERRADRKAKWPWPKERASDKGSEVPDGSTQRRLWTRFRNWGADILRGLPGLWDWFCAWFPGSLCGHGESVTKVVVSMAAVWLFFAILYGVLGGVYTIGPGGQVGSPTRNVLDLLWFSLGAMTTIEPAGLQARSTPVMRALVPIEAFVGIALAGLFGFVLGNWIRRA